MRFEQPWFLLLLLALPVLALLARASRSGLERGRSIAGTILRAILFTAVVFSLADAHWVSKTYRTCTIFLLDHSFSIPPEIQRKAFTWIDEHLQKNKLPKDDWAGVIVFGDEAMIEVPPGDQPLLSGPHSLVGRAATDIGAAIRLALAVFPQGYQRRIVLVSDGNENKGHAVAEAELARAQGVVIDVFPLRYDYPNEVWMEGLHVPADILPREPFDVTAVVNSQREGEATLGIYRNGDLLSHQKVQLNKGKNVFTVKQRVEGAGNYVYEAVIEMPGDTVTLNNVAHAFASARGEARVAVVAGEPVDGEELVKALKEEGLNTSMFTPEDLMGGRFDTAAFDAIVFANVEAIRLGQAGMQAVEAAVHEAGVGFVMVGGEKSYGPGGYRGTPIEELLPVTMEQPQRRVIPNGALCLILHTVEIPEGNYWAKQIGLASLNVLGPRDYMGVVLYGMGEEWLFPMQQIGENKGKLANLISSAQPGDMPDFEACYKMAHKGMAPVNAAAKHIIAISDADPSGPSDAVIDAIVKDRITISTVAINPHSGSDIDRMARTAVRGKGRPYHVQDPKKLPQIFIKEAATIQRSMIIEGDIPAVVLANAQALTGISPREIPLLHGYTLTHPKDHPLVRTSLGAPVPKEQNDAGTPQMDALLAEWTYGLGRTMAFTSDAKPRWARDWVAWPNYRKFWSQAVRSVLRTVPRAPFTVQSSIEGGKGKVLIDAVDESGKFIHTLDFAGSVTNPDGQKSDLPFRQVGPGRYEAQFDANAVGTYSITGNYKGAHGEQGYISQGVALSYAAEYRDLKTNVSLLNQLYERTYGRKLSAESRVYERLERSAGVAMPLWPYLLMLVLILFPIDIFIRRVAVDWVAVAGRLAARLRPVRAAAKPVEVPAQIQALKRRKEEIRAVQLTPVSSPVDLESGPATTRPAPVSAPAPAPPQPPPHEAGGYLERLLEAKKKSKNKE